MTCLRPLYQNRSRAEYILRWWYQVLYSEHKVMPMSHEGSIIFNQPAGLQFRKPLEPMLSRLMVINVSDENNNVQYNNENCHSHGKLSSHDLPSNFPLATLIFPVPRLLTFYHNLTKTL